MKIVILSLSLLFSLLTTPLSVLYAEETCGRTALINGQRILVDTNSVQKGEGLKHYIDKDPVAKEYLDIYRQGVGTKWQNAALGTIGTLLVLSGLLIGNDSTNKKAMMVGGASLMVVNFFVARTYENSNENNLHKSVDEYNRRNAPKIFLENSEKDRPGKGDKGIIFNLIKDF